MRRLDILLTFATFVHSGWSLMCYECNTYDVTDCSTVDYSCPYASTYFMEDIKKSYFPESKVNYSDPKNLPEPVCVTVTSVGNGEKQTSRRCSAVGAKLTCDVLRIDSIGLNQEIDFCDTCDKDLCNAAKKLICSTLTIVFPAFLLLRHW